MTDSDDKVRATVAVWERNQGLEVTDWIAVGEQEREGQCDFCAGYRGV